MTIKPKLAEIAERISPFSCGSQYAAWEKENCFQCWKSYREEPPRKSNCVIEEALGAAYWGDGTISAKHAERMGYKDEEIPRYIWECPEREMRRTARIRKPKIQKEQLKLL